MPSYSTRSLPTGAVAFIVGRQLRACYFLERRLGELRRIYLPRTSVNTVTAVPGKRQIYPLGVCYVLAQVAYQLFHPTPSGTSPCLASSATWPSRRRLCRGSSTPTSSPSGPCCCSGVGSVTSSGDGGCCGSASPCSGSHRCWAA